MDVKLKVGDYINEFFDSIGNYDGIFSDYMIECSLMKAAEDCGIQKIYKNEQHTNISDTPGDGCFLE